ncbi:MAG: 23S rRNA (guanosine(2251)-2'-O)-methyltransferase RlmB [Eubacteriales bacterium]
MKNPYDRKNPDRKYAAPVPSKENSDDGTESGILYGRNSAMEALKSGKTIDKLFVHAGDREGSITVIIAKAKAAGIPVIEVTKEKLDSLSGGGNHQGVVAMTAGVDYVDLDALFAIAEEKGEAPFFVIADGVEDPHNLGAIIRCAEGAGAHGLILSKRHCCPITPTVVKASAGAIEHMAVAKVPNIVSAIEELKDRGVWIYGAEADGSSLYETDLSGAAAFVVGSEGKGISRLVREKCDFVLSIPMYGQVNSFNVSCAAAVLLCKAAEDRHMRNK